MKKILVTLAVMLSFLSAINVQKASKDDLMCIKGIGEKKASAIIKYRKSHTLKSADDLLDIKGFGKGLVKNVQKDIKSIACGGKKSSKSTTKKDTTEKSSKSTTKKDTTKKSSKSTTKKDTTKKSSKSTTKKDTTKK